MDERQLSLNGLFVPRAATPIAGSLHCGPQIRQLLSECLKQCPSSRFGVASRMSELLGSDITKSQLDAWTAESREAWRFPFEYAAAFEEATATFTLTEFLAAQRGCKVAVGDEALLTELGRIEQAEQALKQRKVLIKDFLEQHHPSCK